MVEPVRKRLSMGDFTNRASAAMIRRGLRAGATITTGQGKGASEASFEQLPETVDEL